MCPALYTTRDQPTRRRDSTQHNNINISTQISIPKRPMLIVCKVSITVIRIEFLPFGITPYVSTSHRRLSPNDGCVLAWVCNRWAQDWAACVLPCPAALPVQSWGAPVSPPGEAPLAHRHWHLLTGSLTALFPAEALCTRGDPYVVLRALSESATAKIKKKMED